MTLGHIWSVLAPSASIGVALVVGVLASFLASKLSEGNHPVGTVLAGLVTALVVFGGLQIWAEQASDTTEIVSDVSANDSIAEPVATPESAATDVQASSESEPDATPSDTPTDREPSDSPPTPVVMSTSILDLTAVEQDVNDSIDLSELETTQIDGASYGRVLAYECSLYCDGTSPQVLEVALGRQFSVFSAKAVVFDSSTGEYRVDVTRDSLKPETYEISPGNPALIGLDVTGISRLRIEMFGSGELKSPLQAGADSAVGDNGGGLPGVALGDPTVLP